MIVELLAPEDVPDAAFGYAVTVARYQGKWVFCRHRERDTWEMPGGHREPGEAILETAKRELYEETGALEFALRLVCGYSVTVEDTTTYGMVYYAEIAKLGPLPESEIRRIEMFERMPDEMTYPKIQPLLLEMVQSTLKEDNSTMA